MRPLYLRLRRFKGIKSGTGLDEIELDFTRLPNGLIVFDSPNGTGKTTILDSMTPYRLMPYRAGDSYSPKAFSYYDNVYGHDAYKELIFEMDGIRYRSVINIDAERKKQEAYLFIDSGNGSTRWKPVNKDGKTESYDQAVEEIMGSPRLFFTSIFRCQGAKSLSDYTKGDMKDLFAELLCIEDLKAKSEKARAVKNALIQKLEFLQAEKTRLEGIIGSEAKGKVEFEELSKRIEAISLEILSKEKEIQDMGGQIQGLDLKISLQQESLKKKASLEGDIKVKENRLKELRSNLQSRKDLYNSKYKVLKEKINTARKLIEAAPALREKAKEEIDRASEAEAIKTQLQSLDEQFVSKSARLSEFNKTESLIKDKEKELQGIRLFQRHSIEMAGKALKDAEKTARKLQSVPCSAMDIAQTCMFVKDAVDAKKSLPSLMEALAKASESVPREGEISAEIVRLKITMIEKPSVENEIKDILKGKESSSGKLKAIEKELALIREALKSLPEIELSEKSLPEYEAQLQDIYNEGNAVIREIEDGIKDVEAEIEAVRNELSKIVIDETLAEQKKKLQLHSLTVRNDLERKRKEEAEIRKTLGAVEETIRGIEKSKDGLNIVQTKMEYFNTEISEWALLERSLGNDGLIALGIDDAGPTISAIANDLLLTCFGPRFSVRIDTQSIKADRRSVKEVFDITVFDAERNEVKSIKHMSGGEKTWIEDAITKAICLYNKQRSNKTFLTIFTDEKDGALDAEKKKEFFSMKKRVLEIGGYEREFCITQTPELQELADGRIVFSENGISLLT